MLLNNEQCHDLEIRLSMTGAKTLRSSVFALDIVLL